jgi:hypothetical protein
VHVVTPVPTLSLEALATLATLIVVFGWLQVRRARRN